MRCALFDLSFLRVAAAWPLIWCTALLGQEILADSAADEIEISAYDTIVVGEFKDSATADARFSGDTPEEIEAERRTYEADVAVASRNFSLLLLQELQLIRVFSAIVPAGTSYAGRALLIEGEITRLDRGNLTTRILVGMGIGRAQFDVVVRVRDAETDAEISETKINRGSGILGGFASTAITVEYLMQRSAMKVASDLRREKCSKMVCEESAELTVAASEEADRAAKAFEVPESQCRVYFYVSLPGNRDDDRSVEVWSDEEFLGVIDSEDGYFMWPLDSGDHEIFTRYLSKSLRRSVGIECTSGVAIFVHHEVKSQMIERLLLEPEKNGRRDVRRRHLVIPQPAD